MQKLIFDLSRDGVGGKWLNSLSDDVPDIDYKTYFSGLPLSDAKLNLPEVTEVDLVRHYTNLSYQIYGIDNGPYVLGSCTMKYNPKAHDYYVALDGFRYIHPLQPVDSAQGTLNLMYNLQTMLAEISGMDNVTVQPGAGAHGEFSGLLVIKKYLEKNNKSHRNVVLIADSAHGTNPASAKMVGFVTKIIKTNDEGTMDLEELNKSMDENVAALMITNPSTLGLFERNIEKISEIVHSRGGLLYYDGANLNALLGVIRPGDMGFDVLHMNTHKTFSTPHGGGGPGAGPIGVKKFLTEFLPVPYIVKDPKKDYYYLDSDRPNSIGSVKAFYGHVNVLIRAYCYIMALGPEGLVRVSKDAVLNANYLQCCLSDIMPRFFHERYCMHECLLSTEKLPTNSYNFAKRLIDYSIHPPTLLGAGCVFFPERFSNTMLIEPTETESKASLDEIVKIFHQTYEDSLKDLKYVDSSPHKTKTKKVPEKPEEMFDES